MRKKIDALFESREIIMNKLDTLESEILDSKAKIEKNTLVNWEQDRQLSILKEKVKQNQFCKF